MVTEAHTNQKLPRGKIHYFSMERLICCSQMNLRAERHPARHSRLSLPIYFTDTEMFQMSAKAPLSCVGFAE